jgi:hypothetical protein
MTTDPNQLRAVISIRVIVIANFVLMLILIGPGSSHRLDLTLRRLGVENFVGRILQLWIIGSSLFVTALFVAMVWKNRRTEETDIPRQRLRLEGMLVIAWWLVLVVVCAYGFILGMGG